MDYPKSVPNIGLVDGHFVDENPITGQIGSLIPAAWGDSITQEMLNVIKGAGLVPDENDVAQLLQAITSISASDYKRSVRCATTGPIALSGLQTIDGVTVTAGERVLVKDQANAAQNWIYTAGAGAWVRAQDANESIECTPGHVVPVQSGTANALSAWQLSNTDAPTLGTTHLVFIKVRGKVVEPGAYGKVAVDEQGRVTAGTNPNTLAGHNIADAYTKTEVEALLSKASALPVGVMAALPVNKIPPGWLEVDHSVHSIATYPDLAAFLGGAYNDGTEPAGYFRLPESRGEFLRGWDHNRGVDTGRALGSYQADAIQRITGSFKARVAQPVAEGALSAEDAQNENYGGTTSGAVKTVSFDASRVARTAAETRPRNLAVMWCIKAWNAPINQGQIDIAALAVQVAQFQNQVDFAVVYPAGGSKANPANVAINSRYVEASPFPGATVICRAEVLRNGSWVETGFGDHTSLGGTRVVAGVHAAQLGDSIIVQTALNYLTYPSTYSGDPSGSGDSVATPLPCRVLVWKVRGVIV